ncbi:MAG: hypothetical protein G3M70_08230 [Candidatus Nitronauta litoralis]|uniref:Uncharacterized protein n=1 Tax=Candidatus Nitronauta litoralis TaxID=2705533 RepID=A0A7T0G0H9_9BACT|nr:MAG: hypothetical protein G3M70_08230 [Candidatus Nitronauta litoralis]
MGFAVSWMAIKGKPQQKILDALELGETGEKEKDVNSGISGALLPNNWYLIFLDEFESKYVSDKILIPLSEGCEMVVCNIEEHVMYSSAQYWGNGRKLWQVSHDSQQGMLNLEEEGILPEDFENIKSVKFAEQKKEGGEKADVDCVFDIPLHLAEALTGFRHDMENPDFENIEFSILVSMNPNKPRPWWKFW